MSWSSSQCSRQKNCPKYTYRKDGVFYFLKAVPKDLLDLYCKSRIVMCMGTRSPQSAQLVATAILAKLEDDWLGVRLKRMEVLVAESVRCEPAFAQDLWLTQADCCGLVRPECAEHLLEGHSGTDNVRLVGFCCECDAHK